MGKYFEYILKEYRRRYTLYSGITAGIFLLQIFHLYWLSTHVVAHRLLDESFFDPNQFWQVIIVIVDYLEIPAIISASFLYLFSLGQSWNKKDFWLLLLLNTQWLHIFWISDEFVESALFATGQGTILPIWLAWIAIFIDYLELPVIYDTVKKFLISLKEESVPVVSDRIFRR